jgi:hypothetical protein
MIDNAQYFIYIEVYYFSLLLIIVRFHIESIFYYNCSRSNSEKSYCRCILSTNNSSIY